MNGGYTCALRVQAAAVVTVVLATLATAIPLDPSGDLDPDFSGDGRATANFSSVLSFAEARGVAIQSNGRIVLGGSSVEGGVTNHFALIRLHTDGTQDMSFGAGGVTKTALGTFDLINDVAVQADDKIVAAGFGTGTGDDFIIARYTADGALDTTFAAPNGYLKVDYAGAQDRANALVVQDDGKIVVAGFRQDNATTGRDVALVRLNTDGTLDGTFGSGGKVVTAVAPGTGDDRAFAVIVVGSGAGRKILAGGRTRLTGGDPNLLLVQYTNAGALDGGFGTGGIRVLDIPGNGCDPGFGCGEEIRDLALQPDGKIVAAGGWTTVDNPINKNPKTTMLTARFTATGAFDTTFDADGWVITSIVPSFFTDFGESVAVQADGKIVSFGWSDQSDLDLVPADHDFLFVRLNANGSRDATYGTGGPLPGVVLVELSDGDSFDDGDAMVLDSAGRAIGVGLRTTQTGNSYIGAARLTIGGALDTTFGPDGPDPDTLPDGFFITQLIGGSRDEAGGVVVQADGKTVVAGWTDVGSNSFDFALARFNADGTLDSGFGGGDGLANASNGVQNDTGRAVALQTDGKIVVAGDSYGTLTPSFTLMRFTTAGVLDSGFGGAGVVTTTFGTNGNTAYALAIQPDGKILAGGSVSDVSTNWDFGLARFDTNGALDSTFGAGGKVRLNIGAFDEIHAIALRPDGKIVVGGRSSSGSHFFFVLARFNANGSLDTTFASPSGFLTTRLSDAANLFAGDEIRGLVLLPDGRIVAGGKALNAAGLNAFALARFNANGSLDTTLDGDGKIFVNLGGNNQDEINGIALQFDEKVVAFGNSFSFTTGANDFGLARFNWDDGSLDTTYGTDGVVTTEFAGFDRAIGGTVLSGGKAVAGGTTGGNDFAAARYLGDPAPTVPGSPPGAPPDLAPGSDSGISNADDVTNDSTPTFQGGCVTGETVVLRVNGLETVPRTRGRCIGGAYAVTSTVVIPDGVHAVTTFSINGAGASAGGGGLAVTIDTIALPPTIVAPAAASTVNPNPTISGGGAEPAASVTVREGAATVCAVTADGTGAWSCASSLLPGSHTVTATQTDIAGNTSAPSATRTFAIKAPTTTAITSNVNPTVFGQPVTFTATVSSGFGTPNGTVDFVVDGAAPVSVALSASGQATLVRSNLTVGAHSVTASYPGATLFFPSSGGPLAHTVNKADTSTSVASSANPSVFGQSVTLTATVAAVAPGAGTPTGTVTFMEGATPLATVALNASGQAAFTSASFPLGLHSVTAEYAGDGNFNGSGPSAIAQTVDKASSSTTLLSSANPSVFGQSVTFTATVAAVAPGAGTPTGTVTFMEGATPLATVALNASGQAAFTSASFPLGLHSVTAEYAGDGNFNGSGPSGLTQTVDRAGTGTAVASSIEPSGFGQSVTFTATVNVSPPGVGTPTGTVTFRDGVTTLGTGTLDAFLQATLATSTLSVGSHSITAEFGGDGNFSASVSAPLTQTVLPSADLSVTKDDATASVEPGATTTYTIVVTNLGPSAVTGATVTDTLPAEATGGSWTCVGGGGGTCSAAGAGSINDTVNLPAGASVTYTFVVDLAASPTSSTITNTAGATVPAGHADPDLSNDTASDVDTFCLDPATGCGNYYTVTPCRLVDTRNAPGPSGGPVLSANTPRTFPVAGLCGIPADARVVAVIVTVFNQTALGGLRFYPAGATPPFPWTISFNASRVRNNNAFVGLGSGGQISVTCDMPTSTTGSTHFVLDVVGYFK